MKLKKVPAKLITDAILRDDNATGLYPEERAFCRWVREEFENEIGFIVRTSAHAMTLGLEQRAKLKLSTTTYPEAGDIVVFQCESRPRWKLVGLFVGNAILRPERVVKLQEVTEIIGVVTEPRGLKSPQRVA